MWQLLVSRLGTARLLSDVSRLPPPGSPPAQPPTKGPGGQQTPPAPADATPSPAAVQARKDADNFDADSQRGVLDKSKAAEVLRKDVLELAQDTAGLGPALVALDETPPNLAKAIRVIRDVTDDQIQRLKEQIDRLKNQGGPVQEAPGPTKENPAAGPTLETPGPTNRKPGRHRKPGPTLEVPPGPTKESIGPTREHQAGPTAEIAPGPTAEIAPGPTAEGRTGPTSEAPAGPTAEGHAGPTAEGTKSRRR